MKWTAKEEDKLRKLCSEDKSNAEMAKIFNCEVKDIHAARSRLGITIPAVKAAKEAEAKKAAAIKPAKKTAPKNVTTSKALRIETAFDDLDLALLNAAAADTCNANSYRLAAAGVSTLKSLLLGSLNK